MVHVHPLTAPAPVRLVPPPELAGRARAALAEARRRVEAHPDRFDGPVLMVLEASPDGVVAYRATYAWRLAAAARGATVPGAGTLGARLLLRAGDGRFLWQRRGARVDSPGLWSFSAAGIVDPDLGPAGTIVAEAREELGLAADDLVGLRPAALLAGALEAGGDAAWGHSAAEVVFTAELAAGSRLRPGAEVAEVCWSPSPGRLVPAERLTPAAWPALAPLVGA
jgi:8-oxo-dGTP pyrophosphatase MutT (NUDIX family)